MKPFTLDELNTLAFEKRFDEIFSDILRQRRKAFGMNSLFRRPSEGSNPKGEKLSLSNCLEAVLLRG
jgi:hypothetical protein